MTPLLRSIALTLAVLVVSTAAAQKVGEPAPEMEFEDKLNDRNNRDKPEGLFFVKDMRGRIGVFFFFRSTNPESLEAMTVLNEIAKKYRSQGVVVAAFTPEKKEKAEAVAKAKDLAAEKFVYGNGPEYLYQVASYPFVFIIDPQGIIAWKGHPLDDLESRVKDQMRKTPPIGADESALAAKLAKAEELQGKGEFGRAYTLAQRVAQVTSEGVAMHGKATALMAKLVENAKTWLQQAKDAYRANDYKKASKIVAEISVRFANKAKEGPEHDLIVDVDTEIGKLRGGNESKDMITRDLDNAKGELKNDEARQLEDNNDFIAAVRVYREVLDEMPKNDAGKTAKAGIDRINADPKIQERMRRHRTDKQAERWFDMAERYARVKMYAEAREQYQKVIKEFPKSAAASKAREALKKLPADDKDKTAKADAPGANPDKPDERADASKP